MSGVVPKFKKYRKRQTIKPHEKGQITRMENALKFADSLISVDKRQAKQLKEQLYQPTHTTKSGRVVHIHGIQAVQFRNTSSKAKIKRVVRGKALIEDQGFLWLYSATDDFKPRTILQRGREAFTMPESYEIEKVLEAAKRAFANPETKAVYLWAQAGRAGGGFRDFKTFARWVKRDYSQYKNTEKWVRGISILVGEASENVPRDAWRKFGRTQRQLDEEMREREPGEDDEDYLEDDGEYDEGEE